MRDLVFSEEKFAEFAVDNEDRPIIPLAFGETDAINPSPMHSMHERPISANGPVA